VPLVIGQNRRELGVRPTSVFISYKTGEDDGLTFTANTIRQHLDRADGRYKVWMDVGSLRAGEEWNHQIYEQIPRSDVLLLLTAESTAKSNWVGREVDLAKGARVTVLPVLIRGGFETKAVMERFDLATVQYVKLLNGGEDELQALVRAIEELKDKTEKAQRQWLSELQNTHERVSYQGKYKKSDRSFASFDVEMGGTTCSVRVAAGDMFAMGAFDVYVNSENDYLQMARIFESRTVSSLLRYYGSNLDGAGRIVDDTVQRELDEQIRSDPSIGARPVLIGTVVATHAGHENSVLRRKLGGRYIFHTATVSVEGDGPDKRLRCNLMNAGIRRCVRASLDKVAEVDGKQGVGLNTGAGAGEYKPIRSIILPIFGAGHGGRFAEEVIPALVDGVKEFLIDAAEQEKKKPGQFHLEEIYLAAYLEDDALAFCEVLGKDDFFKSAKAPSRPQA